MPDARLLTVRDIARELGLPESTVRYYRDAFAHYLPAVGTGRRRRYPPDAIPLLRLVAEGYSQNRPRTEIEQALSELLAGDVGHAVSTIEPRAPYARDARGDELLTTILHAERERREVMWQMARELVRLGEAIERLQAMLARMVEQKTAAEEAQEAAAPRAALGAASSASAASPDPAAPSGTAEMELDTLRRELAHERELVERLRRAKLDIERRAAEAEAKLGEKEGAHKRRDLLSKFRPQGPYRRR